MQKQDNLGYPSLKLNGKTIIDAKEKTEVINDHLSQAFTKGDLDNLPDKGDSPFPEIPQILINSNGVEKLLRKLNPSKASGPDDLSAR